ncbi:Abi-alpha family protein [Nocardioides sp.]|uniref:Abi-alpha family protein n=1 Tax=Nocardioides sp. TaxID=35761 RepID=UPI003518A919
MSEHDPAPAADKQPTIQPGVRLPARARRRAEVAAPDVVESLPGLARVAASAAWHTTGWSVRTSARTAWRVSRALTSQQEAVALARDAGRGLAVVGSLARSVSAGTPVGQALMSAGEALGAAVDLDHVVESYAPAARLTARSSGPQEPTLRDRGQDLLNRSRDVWSTEQGHPAYERILDELAPDEARILMLLVRSGPQPTVDVRTGGPIGLVSSTLVAPGLTMIGPRAGCRYVDQVPAYLNNLFRLGLIWFSREALRDPLEYQVVEAQPDVLEAMHSVKFPKVVRRSIHLTPFGEDFCRRVLLTDEELEREYPEHSAPQDTDDLT